MSDKRVAKRGPFKFITRGDLIAMLLALLVLVIGFAWGIRQTELGRESCERSSDTNVVVFQNTRTAVDQSRSSGDPPTITARYEANLAQLIQDEYVNADDGSFDCTDAIPYPWPLPQLGIE